MAFGDKYDQGGVLPEPDVHVYAPIVDDREREIHNRFTYHAPTDSQAGRYQRIRYEAGQLARTFASLCPACPELDRAIDKIDEAVMLANAAIARHSR